MKIKTSVDNIVIAFILIQSLLYIFFFPNLENPDGAYHYMRIANSDTTEESAYYLIFSEINQFFVETLNINDFESMESNPNFKYFSWDGIFIHGDHNYWNVMLLQLVHVFLIMLAIQLYLVILKLSSKMKLEEKRMFFRLGLLYFLYPAVSYLIIGITPDFFIYLYQPFFVLFLFRKKHVINLILALCLFFCIDEGVIINIYFILLYCTLSFIFKMKLDNKYRKIIGLLFISIVLIYIVNNFIFVNLISSSIYDIMRATQESNGTLYTKIINFALSSFYFTGSGSYITFPLFYVIYGLVVLAIFYHLYKDRNQFHGKLFSVMVTAVIVITTTILLFPAYSHIRFFLFLPILLLMALFAVIFNDKYIMSDRKYLLFSSILFFHNSILIMLISIKTFIF